MEIFLFFIGGSKGLKSLNNFLIYKDYKFLFLGMFLKL